MAGISQPGGRVSTSESSLAPIARRLPGCSGVSPGRPADGAVPREATV